MSDELAGDRSSEAASPWMIVDPDERARREAENGLKQFDTVVGLVERFLAERWRFALRISTILGLHREIHGSKHIPPDAFLVPLLLEELCDYVNDHWQNATPLQLSAYVMWRLNWIHPFADGNGRTARAVSYLVLCMKMGSRIPGTRTIPGLISQNKKPYYDALEIADEIWAAEKRVDLTALEELLETLLAAQLVSAVEQAKGQSVSR